MLKESGTDREDVQLNTQARGVSAADGWCGDICRGIAAAYFVVMTVLYPFYAPGGYFRIGEVKFAFFRNITLAVLAAAAVVILASAAVRLLKGVPVTYHQNMSVTDWFVYGYFLAVLLSFLCSDYRKEALWGVEGWRMGAITQLLFVFLYFLFSRYFSCHIRWIGVWLAAAAAVFLLGICNRYSLYPVALAGQTDAYLSTLGNINWFCGYWSLAAALGIALYWRSSRVWVRAASGVYCVIAMLIGIVQGSESAFLVFALLGAVLLVMSFDSGRGRRRLAELCILFGVACVTGSGMALLPGLRLTYVRGADASPGIASVLLSGAVSWGILAAAVCCYAAVKGFEKKKISGGADGSAASGGLRRYVPAIAALLCLCGAAALCLGGRASGGTAADADGFLTVFADGWGNGRGAAWNCGINAFLGMSPLQKLIGIGPDCFAEYVYDVPMLAGRLADRFVNQRLTNAHNELLTMAVNLGLLGAGCYVGILASALVRFGRRIASGPMPCLCFTAVLAYTVHNLVSFQHVLSTPYLFILLGIGEGVCRAVPQAAQDTGLTDEAALQAAETPDGGALQTAAPYEPSEKEQLRDCADGVHRLAEKLTALLMTAVCGGLIFYARDGYHGIGDAKFVIYRNLMIPGCLTLLVLAVVYAVCRTAAYNGPKEWFVSVRAAFGQTTATDRFVLCYLILTGIAAAAGGFRADAFWGSKGWYMGFMSQLSFVLIYLAVSRCGRYHRVMTGALLLMACAAYGIGILHRLQIDPLGFYEGLSGVQRAEFLSTLGQATWYGSFLIVTLPVGMGGFLFAQKKPLRILYGIFLTVGFCTLVTQNSDSAYIGLLGALLVFVVPCAGERRTMGRYMRMLTLFFAAGKGMGALMRRNPAPDFYPDSVTALMWDSALTWVLLFVCLAASVLLAVRQQAASRLYPAGRVQRWCRWLPALAAAAAAGAAALVVMNAVHILPAWISERLQAVPYLVWNAEWGNGRGRIWSFSARLFAGENLLQKLFGIGPDCFYSYASACHGEEAAALWGSMQLTNAHNEWLNILINGGVFGMAAYAGIFVSSIRSGRKSGGTDGRRIGIAAACAAYMCCNFFCYQQVLCTPFIFLLMGVGAYLDKTRADG